MIDCSKKNFIDFCKRQELINLPEIQLILYENTFKYFHSFNETDFNEWISSIFSKEANECNI